MTPVHLVRFGSPGGEAPEGTVVVDTLIAFMSSASFDAAALNSAVTREIERALAPDELVILVRGTSEADTVAALGGRDFDALVERVTGRTEITVVGYGADGQESFRRPLRPGGPLSAATVAEMLRRGVTDIFRRHGGFIEPNANFHFAGPSGRHTNRFMRLSNILVRQAEIAFMAVAVMRLIPPSARFAYIDTPALYAVVSAVNEQWRTLAPEREPLMADNFRSYDGLDTYPFSDYAEAVVLISASSSGSLSKRLVNRGFPPASVVHVLFHGKVPGGLVIAVDLGRHDRLNPGGYPADREIYEATECKMCARNSVAIPLRGDQFDIQGPQPQALTIQRDDAPANLGKLMHRLAGKGVFSVKSGPRQHWVDAPAMMAACKFQERLDFFVRRYVPAGIEHCILADPGSRPLAEWIMNVTRSPMKLHEREQVDSTGRHADDLSPILVVASVIASGRTLLEISRDLREVCRKASVIYLIGLAKFAGDDQKRMLKKNLVQTHHHAQHMVEVVEELLLPEPASLNPWQQELDFLRGTSPEWPEAQRGLLHAREDRLRRASEPMTDNLFVSNESTATLKLQSGFAFWPSNITGPSQADVYFTMSAVMQQLRTAPVSAGGQALRTNWLQQTLLSPENFGRFNDGVIQASILRAATAAELDYRDDAKLSQTAMRIMRRVLEAANRARGEAAVEFLIALGCKRLRFQAADTSEVLKPLEDPPPLVEAFRILALRALQV